MSRTSPAGLNLTTVCPRPDGVGDGPTAATVAASAIQILPALSTSIPWGHMNNCAPMACTTLPLASSLTIGATSDSAQELAPQRSAAQIC